MVAPDVQDELRVVIQDGHSHKQEVKIRIRSDKEPNHNLKVFSFLRTSLNDLKSLNILDISKADFIGESVVNQNLESFGITWKVLKKSSGKF